MQTELFPVRLAELRDMYCITYDELADNVGSTKSYMWELENKPFARPSAELVHRIAKYFDTTVAYLLGDQDPNEAMRCALVNKIATLEENDINKLWKLLDIILDD